jgi:hypothetical protein
MFTASKKVRQLLGLGDVTSFLIIPVGFAAAFLLIEAGDIVWPILADQRGHVCLL